MARELKDIYWLAGLLEGEGCFGMQKNKRDKGYPFITVKMADKDIVWRAKTILGSDSFYIRDLGYSNPNHSTMFETRVGSKLAIAWMMTLFPLMGMRRKAKIKDTLIEWRARRQFSRSMHNFMKSYAARRT